jgi:hypothetical protein
MHNWRWATDSVRTRPQALSVTPHVLSKSALGLLAAALAAALAGCNSDWIRSRERAEEIYGTAPTNYRADILAFMRTYLNDPSGVRDAFISEPSKRTLDNVERYTVCLRYNARKAPGQYAGSKDSLVLFREGRFDHIVDNAKEQCKDAAYQPFPELEHLSR